MSNNILQIKGLQCGYKNFSLTDINLNVNEGEIIGVIGPNGSGKTTLLKAIARLLKPKAGQVLFNDTDIWHLAQKELARKIAVVTQNTSVSAISVEDYVLLGRIPHYKKLQFFESCHDIEAAHKALGITDTYKVKDNPISEISAGELQLASIARALAQEPQLLLLDEPTSHLDIGHQIQVLNLVKELHRQMNLTVIMVLHDLNLASQYCQRLVLLSGGRIHSEGSPSDILTPQLIHQVYKAKVVIEDNPLTHKPALFLLP
ncbi:MAG: ABC transporter ATP-binding protein [Candidatus Omnitrophota bacterium]|nr:MAG: ABC transporter ATP-binding protein [Candidatus Omnitrophota bacterium]